MLCVVWKYLKIICSFYIPSVFRNTTSMARFTASLVMSKIKHVQMIPSLPNSYFKVGLPSKINNQGCEKIL